MKTSKLLMALAALLFSGCVYESPLTQEHSIPIDPTALGLWERIPEDGEAVDPDTRMVVMKYSETEYSIHYPTGKNGVYWRAYPIKIGGVPCIQLQAIGTEEGPVPAKEKKLFNVASYQMIDGTLIIKTLNTHLIGKNLVGSEALRKAFLEHKDSKDLFTNPGRFKKIQSDQANSDIGIPDHIRSSWEFDANRIAMQWNEN